REDKDRQVLFDVDKGVILPSNLDAFKTSKTSFAPRLSVAWSPYQSGSGYFGGGKTVIRAGFGINYGPGPTEDPIQPIECDRIKSAWRTGRKLFPSVILAIGIGYSATPSNRSYEPRASQRANYEAPERIYSYMVSVQQDLPSKMAVTFTYVGSEVRHLFL